MTDLFGAGENVAVFGSFTRSVSIGKLFRSPFAIHAKVRDGKIVFFQFMEETIASAGRSARAESGRSRRIQTGLHTRSNWMSDVHDCSRSGRNGINQQAGIEPWCSR